MGSVQKHPARRLKGIHQIRHRLRKHGIRQCGSEDEGEAGSTSRTRPEDLLRIVTRNSQSIAGSEVRSTSAELQMTTSTVRLRCEDPERQRSPDGERHEGLLAEHLCHVPAGQRNFLHKGQEGPRRHQYCRRTLSTTRNSIVDPAVADGEVSSRTSQADLPTDRRSDDVTLADGLGQQREWRILLSSTTRRPLQDQVPHPTSTEGYNDDPPTARTQQDERKPTQDPTTRQRRRCHLSNTGDKRTLPADLSTPEQLQDELRRECIRINRPYDIKTILTTACCTDASSTTGSCQSSVNCKQPYSNPEDYATSIFIVKKRS